MKKQTKKLLTIGAIGLGAVGLFMIVGNEQKEAEGLPPATNPLESLTQGIETVVSGTKKAVKKIITPETKQAAADLSKIAGSVSDCGCY